jgi:hypothetical protein
VKVGLKVKQKEGKGKIEIEIGWKRTSIPKATDLLVQTGPSVSTASRKHAGKA